jgi:hypothetical protein
MRVSYSQASHRQYAIPFSSALFVVRIEPPEGIVVVMRYRQD